MNRGLGLTLLLLAYAGAACSKDLVGVFADALSSDPQIRQADANRLAAREARPQAWSALLPQISGAAAYTRDHSAGFSDQITVNPANGALFIFPAQSTADATRTQWSLNLR